jgi:pimeloyl-ACP methyl ester carboxylesterase
LLQAMSDRLKSLPDLPAFAQLPLRRLAVGPAGERMAVHVSGRLASDRIPVICVPGFQRNMSDYADLARLFSRVHGEDWPVVLVDLKGRGRSSDRRDRRRYASPQDAADLTEVVAALAAPSAIFVGQGYGGQVIMALAALRPSAIAGAVLIDAGPVSDPRSLVRLRHNIGDLATLRGEAGLRAMQRRILATDYPALPEPLLDKLAGRTHYADRRGRARALFDPNLVRILDSLEHDDVLVPQWKLYEALRHVPLMLMRTQLTDQLRRETFEQMMRMRRDADAYIIEGQGSPALLDTVEDVEPIAAFVRSIVRPRARSAA